MKRKLSRVQGPWRRRAITILLSVVLLFGKFTPRARAHWIGSARRRRRPERAFTVLLFTSAMVILSGRQFVIWSILVGSMTSIFVVLATFYTILRSNKSAGDLEG